MKVIHGKVLETTNDGEGIYYDNILIRSKRRPLNEYTDWDYWVKRISENPNFCPAQFHEDVRCRNENCKNCNHSRTNNNSSHLSGG